MRAKIPRSSSLCRAVVMPWLGALLGVAACGSEDPPVDCGDPSMSIVTFQGRTAAEEDQIRTCIDLHAASRLDATASSRGLDESFATSRPNAIPWTNLRFGDAVRACGRAGKVLCNLDQLRAITPIAGLDAGGRIQFDTTRIEALSPTNDVTELPHRFDALNRYDMMVSLKTGKPAYPESTGSVAFWTASSELEDKDRDPRIPLMVGRIEGDTAQGGILFPAPVLDPEYRHPLLGFRCCIDAKLRGAFETLPQDPRAVREREDEEVPLAAAE